MLAPYQIVKNVQEAYRGLPGKVARITGKCAEWYSSHGREPKTQNPLQSGNVSEVEHFMRYCRLYEACAPGAGRMLAEMTYAALLAEFCEEEDASLAELHKESSEALQSELNEQPVCEKVREHLEAIGVHARRVKKLTSETTPKVYSDVRHKAAAVTLAKFKNGGKR